MKKIFNYFKNSTGQGLSTEGYIIWKAVQLELFTLT